MPIYEFICRNCNCEFEELCRLGQVDCICPKCGSNKTTKKMSAFSAQSIGKNEAQSITGNHGCSSCHSGKCGSCH